MARFCPQIEFDKVDHCAAFWCESDDTHPEECPVCLERPERLETIVLACGHTLCSSCHNSMLAVDHSLIAPAIHRRRLYSQYRRSELQGDSMRIGFPDHLERYTPYDDGAEYLACGLLMPSRSKPDHFCVRCPVCRRWAKAFPTPSYHARLSKTTRQLWLDHFPTRTL